MFNAATVTGDSGPTAPGRSLRRTATRLGDTGAQVARRSAVESGDGRAVRVNELKSLGIAGLQTEEVMLMLKAPRILRPVGSASFGFTKFREARIMRSLQRSHRTVETPVISVGGPVVSLTSHGKRVETIYLAIESIGQGSLLPSRLILWLDEEAVLQNLPESLVRLQRRGLEIRIAQNYGPHTKYYPYVKSYEEFREPLVTADDDIVYPKYWLERLAGAYVQNPEVIHCYRARVIALQGERLAPYEEWRMCDSNTASMRHFATGVSGAIYSPRFQEVLKRAGSAFQDCCPRADDIWLHANAIRSGHKVRQLTGSSAHFPIIDGTQGSGLQNTNRDAEHAGNDRQIKSTYTPADLVLLGRSIY